MIPQYTIPDDEELDLFLALTLVQRGERLQAMTPTRRVAYAIAYRRRDNRPPYRILDTFASWQQLYLNSLEAHHG